VKPYKRTERISKLLQREVAIIIQREAQELACQGVTVTYAKVSNDMSQAKVYITVFVPEQLPDTLKKLNQAAPHLQHLLAQTLQLRITPKLKFFYDESVMRGQRISALIDDVNAGD